MGAWLDQPERLAQLCAGVDPELGTDVLLNRLNEQASEPDYAWVLTRGNWHRLGGVVDAGHGRVADNLAVWAEQESGGDIEALIARHTDHRYFVTRLAGKTHFFTLPCGDDPEDFIQLEVEEMREVIERPLVDPDWYPDSIEEFLDPLDYRLLEPEPVARPYYQFRRITPIASLLREAPRENEAMSNLRRFFKDWSRSSSASDGEPFCRHWVLALREYMDSDGECRLTAKPCSTFSGRLPKLPSGGSLSGSELANAIHGYDRQLGFPFAWFFIMLSRRSANYALADAVLRDQIGAYDYLPSRDLKVLRQWEERPYAV